MNYDSLEYLRIILALFPSLCVQVLQLQLLPAKIFTEASKRGTLVLLPIFGLKLICRI
jgi:hypothetical protein